MVTVEFQGATGNRLEVAPITWEPASDGSESDPFRVRHLIEKLVRECVRDFHLREKDRGFALLTDEKVAEGLRTGKFGSPREETQQVDVNEAIGSALQAFEDRLYLLFIDKIEKRELDELVFLQPETQITVIRLTALAGA